MTLADSRLGVTKPHQLRQARWFDTFGCDSPRACTNCPTESSPWSRRSSRMRTRVGSPRPRKYLAMRSDSAGASGRAKGADERGVTAVSDFTDRTYQILVMLCVRHGAGAPDYAWQVVPDPSKRPLVGLPLAGAMPSTTAPPRHETVLPAEPAGAPSAAGAALAVADVPGRRSALLRCAADHPALLKVWARLGEVTLAGGDTVAAYAFARVSYHRGLD